MRNSRSSGEKAFSSNRASVNTEGAGAADQRHKAANLEALGVTNFRPVRIKGMQVLEVAHDWFARAESHSGRCTFDGKQLLLFRESLAFRKILRVNSQLIAFRQHYANGVALHDPSNARRDRSEQVPKVEVRNDMIR